MEEKSDLFNFQLNELSLYPISIEFEKEMTSKYNFLSKASDIKLRLQNVSSLLADGDFAINKKLINVVKELEKISEYDKLIQDIENRAKSNQIDLEDLVLEIQKEHDTIIINTEELEKVNDIIIHIEMLKRKYGGSMYAVVEYRDSIVKAKIESGSCKADINIHEKELESLKKK